jgi:hypothetical protein
MALRIVQWTTGNVGMRSVRAVVANPGMELVGCYAWAPDKIGRDVGELCGIGPIGVAATNDIDALLALQPDCVVYNPKWPDVDHLARILGHGINVVTTAAFITGHALGRERIVAACEKGRSSIFGSGMNPGFANLLGIVSAQICDRVDRIKVLESVDSTGYDSPDTERSVGFGRPIDDPGLPAMTAAGTAVFGDGVRLMADALGWELDDVRCVPEYAFTTAPLEMASWSIDAGCVAGIAASWQGIRAGTAVIELNVRWRKGRTLQPDWPIEHGYVIEVEGQPCVRTKLEVFPPPGFEAKSFEDFMVLGMIMTAMPVIDAIPQVCAAPPGIVTYTDMPLPLPRL